MVKKHEVNMNAEMIEAGVIALEECRGAFDDWNLVVAVYTAMESRKVCEGRSADDLHMTIAQFLDGALPDFG